MRGSKLIALIILALLIALPVYSQSSGGFWYPDDSDYLTPKDDAWGIRLISGDFTMTGSFTGGTSTISGDLLPATTGVYDLGNGTYQWKDLYATGTGTFGGDLDISGTSSFAGALTAGSFAITGADTTSHIDERFYFHRDPYYSGTELRMKGGTVSQGVNYDKVRIYFYPTSTDISVTSSLGNQPLMIDYDTNNAWYMGTGSAMFLGDTSYDSNARVVLGDGETGAFIGADGTNDRLFVGNIDWDGIFAYLKTDNLTKDQTFNFPNATGTFITTGNLGDITDNATTGSSWDYTSLTIKNATTDNYVLGYDAASNTFEWLEDQTGALGADSVGDTEIDYATVTLADFTDDINNATTGALTNYMQDEDINTFAELQAWVTDEILLASTSINTFNELDAIVADKTLVNEEDSITFDSNILMLGQLTIDSGIKLGDAKELRWGSSPDYSTGYYAAEDAAVFTDGASVTDNRIWSFSSTTIKFNEDVVMEEGLTLSTTWTGVLRADAGVVSTTSVGSGDITDVGDCTTGACFDGASGNVLQFEGTVEDVYELSVSAAELGDSYNWIFPDDEIADNDLMLGTGAGTFGYVAIPDCDDGSGYLNYDTTAGTFSCGTTIIPSDDAFADSWDGTTTAPASMNAIYDYLISFDADADSSFVDETWYTNLLDGTAAFTDFNGAVIDSDNYVADSIDDTHINWGSAATQVDTDDVVEGSTNKFEGTTAGDYLTLTVEDIDLDVEIYTRTFTMISEATSTYNGSVQHSLPYGITITKVKASTDTGTSTVQLDIRGETTPNTGGSDIMSSALIADTDLASTTAFASSSVPANSWISLDIDTVSGATTTRVTVEYTIVD